MCKEQNRTTEFGGLILLFFSILMLGYFISRNNFVEEIIFFGIAWIGFWLIHRKKNNSNLFRFGLLLRILLLISTPLLSQDYIRFLWDGYLTCEGINPLHFKPSELFHFIEGDDFSVSIYEKINNKEAYSTFFPLQQWTFYIAALTKSKLGGIIVLRVIIIAFDIASYFVLKNIFQRYAIDQNKLSLYWLNPLVILELTGNLHTEGIFICLLLTSLLSLSKMQDVRGGFFLALSFCSALYSLFFLPLLLLKGGKYRWSRFLIGFIPLSVLAFIPFIDYNQIGAYFSSIAQGMQSNKHDISLLRLIHTFGFKKLEFIYLFYYLFAGVIILIVSWKYRYRNRKVLFTGFTLIISITLIFSPSLKPVHAIILLALGLCTNLTFPLIWSGLAFLFYSYFDDSIPMRLKNSLAISTFLIVLIILYKDLKTLCEK